MRDLILTQAVPGETIAEMPNIKLFFRSMFSEWGSGMSGPLSIPLAVLSLFTTNRMQKAAYAALALFVFGYSAYRIWLREHEKRGEAEKQIDRYTPRIMLKSTDRPLNEWDMSWYGADPAPIFTLHHIGGDAAQCIKIQTLVDESGEGIRFDEVSFLDQNYSKELVRFTPFFFGSTVVPSDRYLDGLILFFKNPTGRVVSDKTFGVKISFIWKESELEQEMILKWSVADEVVRVTLPGSGSYTSLKQL